MREQLGSRLPAFTENDFKLLREADTDFYGMNYYTSQFARHIKQPPSQTDFIGNLDELQEDREGNSVGEESGIHWLRSCPDMFRKHLGRVYRLYGKPIYVTENGCPCPGEDSMTREESVNDDYRVRYFELHLDAIGRSVQEGADVEATSLGHYSITLVSHTLFLIDGVERHGLDDNVNEPSLIES